MEAEQALPYEPDYIQDIIRESSETIDPGEHADKVLAELAVSDAWKILKKYILNKRNRLMDLTRESVRSDRFDLQATGFRYLIFDQIDGFAQDIISRVENVAKIKRLTNEAATTEQRQEVLG